MTAEKSITDLWYEQGYEEGFKVGYEEGFKEGYEEGLAEARMERILRSARLLQGLRLRPCFRTPLRMIFSWISRPPDCVRTKAICT